MSFGFAVISHYASLSLMLKTLMTHAVQMTINDARSAND